MKDRFENKVLVPIDFTETCYNALFHAIEAAKKLHSEIILLHVLTHESKIKMEKEKWTQDDIERMLIEIQVKCQNEDKIKVSFLIREGKLFDSISSIAKEQKVYLLVLATHGKHGLQHLFGSFALKVVTRSPVPTLVVQGKIIRDEYKKIILPINNFTEARQSVQWVILFSKIYGSTVHILRQKQSDEESTFRLKIITEQIEDEFKKFEIPFVLKETVSTKHFADNLIQYAEIIEADIITALTDSDILSPDFNHTAWDEKIMFNKAEIPVLMINPEQLGEIYYEYLTLF